MENKSLPVLRDTGIFIQVIGWGKILAIFYLIYFDLQYADEYDFIREKWASFSYTDLAISFCIGMIFIILGDKFRQKY